MKTRSKFTKSQLVELVKDVANNLKPTQKGIALEKNKLRKLEQNIETLYYVTFPIVNHTSLDTKIDYSKAQAVLYNCAKNFLQARTLVTITSLYLDKPLLHSITLTKKQVEKMKDYKENLKNFYRILKLS